VGQLAERGTLGNVRTGSSSHARADRLEVELRAERQRRHAAEAQLRKLAAEREQEAQESASTRRRTAASQQRLRARIAQLEDELGRIEASAGWRIARRAYQLRDRAMPAGSQRRLTYDRVVARLQQTRRQEPTATVDAVPDWDTVSTLAFAQPAQPVASIIVPVCGMAAYTVRCLRALADDPTSVPFEVIVVDDASADSTRTVLARVHGIRTIHNPDNLGFVGACNRGIEAAKGEYVVLLNNDTEVRHGWLDALVATADADDTVGVVGTKLVYPDGRLQEAGGIVWSDGSAWNYGRFDDPQLAPYNYARDVDYCSGACLLVRRELLTELGGLDDRYGPAYYEDVDLAFAARASGRRVVYQPLAIVVHHEGISHGTDERSGVKRFQEINRRAFAEKWADALLDQRDARDARTAQLALARDRRTGPRMLVADHYVPTPDKDAGSLRMARLLELLTDQGCVVTFLPADRERLEPYTSALTQRGIEVLHGSVDVASHLRALAPELALCILSRPSVAHDLMPVVRANAPDAVVVYDTVDLHFVRHERGADVGAAGDSTPAIDELAIVAAADATIAVSDAEAEIVRGLHPDASVFEIPVVHPVAEHPADFDTRRDLLFVGGFQHDPNVDAVTHFVADVLPRIRERLPEVTLTVVGSHTPQSVIALGSSHVRVLGWVPDLTELYRGHRVAIAPLRYGAGLKGKVAESLAQGVPTVATPVGAEGFGAEHRRHMLIGAVPDDFADLVVELYTDPVLWRTLSTEGRQLIDARFSPDAVGRALADMLTRLGIGNGNGA
jgi:GT2 family glycosyltransferase